MVASCLLGGFWASSSSSSSYSSFVFLVFFSLPSFSCLSFLFAVFFPFPFYLIGSGLSWGCGGFSCVPFVGGWGGRLVVSGV